MFTKYLNQFQKAEAEWVQEVLDMHDGDESKARTSLLNAVTRIIASRREPIELTAFEKAVDGCCFASPNWLAIGMAKLRELGRLPPSPESEGRG